MFRHIWSKILVHERIHTTYSTFRSWSHEWALSETRSQEGARASRANSCNSTFGWFRQNIFVIPSTRLHQQYPPGKIPTSAWHKTSEKNASSCAPGKCFEKPKQVFMVPNRCVHTVQSTPSRNDRQHNDWPIAPLSSLSPVRV